MRRDPFRLILLCFFLSGFAGLLFETLWTREFALVFGTSELAVATVLAAYMGGLAAGAALARRWVLRTARPALLYGVLELGIGLGALAVPAAIGAARRLAVALFGGQPAPPDASGGLLVLFHLTCSAAILLVPTAFMGATLPLLARFAVRREEQIGERVALLYATNTAGAVLGTLVAAFWLLPSLGLRHAVWVGVAANALVFCLACLASRGAEPPPALAAEPPSRAATAARGSWVLPLVLAAGVSSFTYEVLWTRLLAQILGGTVYAFGTMLASFLVGIAAGSAFASRLAGTRARAERAFPLSQMGVALLSLLAFAAVDRLPELALSWGAGGGAGPLANAAVAALVLLPGALFIGASFPLAVRILARDDVDASPASARVYAWNTLGAIAGSIGAGFVWIPWLGFHGALAGAAALNLLVAAASAWHAQPRARLAAAAALAGLAALGLFRPGPPWRLLTTSPLDLVAGRLDPRPPEDVFFFSAGRSSTVLVRRGRDGSLELLTNGLPEASVRPRGATLMDNTAAWLTGLPLLARPDARSLLVIGLGAGSALERIPASVERIDVIELEAEVVEANRRVAGERADDPLADPRVRVAVNDARGALQLTGRRWDVIVSQPSHPWTAGAANLFTREFFAEAREHLEPGGVLAQWLAPGFMDELLLRSVLATLRSVFEHVELYWLVPDSAVFFLASDAPLDVGRGTALALGRDPAAFAQLGVHAPEDVAALLLLDDAGTRRLAHGAPLTTDAHNLFQFRAPRALRAPLAPAALAALTAPDDPLLPPDPSWNGARLARRLLESQQLERARRLGESSAQPSTAAAVRGLVALQQGQRIEAVTALRRALERDPGLREAWVALTRQVRDGSVAYSPSAWRASAYPELALVAGAWERERDGDWAALAALDGPLAAVAPDDPLYEDALRLRALWRVERGDPQRAREALTLLDALLPLSHSASDAVLRSRALRARGDTTLALGLLAAILRGSGGPNAADARLLDEVEHALSEIPAGGRHAQARQRVASALAARRLEARGS
jgi:spermidine synthase